MLRTLSSLFLSILITSLAQGAQSLLDERHEHLLIPWQPTEHPLCGPFSYWSLRPAGSDWLGASRAPAAPAPPVGQGPCWLNSRQIPRSETANKWQKELHSKKKPKDAILHLYHVRIEVMGQGQGYLSVDALSRRPLLVSVALRKDIRLG